MLYKLFAGHSFNSQMNPSRYQENPTKTVDLYFGLIRISSLMKSVMIITFEQVWMWLVNSEHSHMMRAHLCNQVVHFFFPLKKKKCFFFLNLKCCWLLHHMKKLEKKKRLDTIYFGLIFDITKTRNFNRGV